MSYIPTAPDLKLRVADLIRRYRKSVDNGDMRNSLLDRRGREEAGRYTTAGGALVTVHAKVRHEEKYIYNPPTLVGYEQRVHVGAVAECHGNGCTDPTFEQNVNNSWLLHEDADEPAERVMESVKAAREWAQSHAEKCRAQAYNGR
ncbi:hypothetical protein [Streptomyces sp.]|uniref:hypothetical protein n=1 Tax=Streptomyces sp. TaxID=1931 RepID=UPI002F94BCD9